MTMTSDTPLSDLRAALSHLDAALPQLSGAVLKDAKAIATSLARLIAKLGGGT